MNFVKEALLASILTANITTVWGQAPGDTLKLSLTDTWVRSDAFSRLVKIKELDVGISQEEIKDAQMERFPELGLMGTAEKATNIPIYDNGLFDRPSQHEVIHTLYKVKSDFYLNIYNGNKLNLKIREDKILRNIAAIRREQATSDIRYKAASLYLELQRSHIFKNVITEDIADQEKQLAEVKAFHKNGVVLKSDVLRVEMELSKRRMTLIEIQNDILITNQKLNILIGEPDHRIVRPDENFEILRNASQQDYEDFLHEALEHSFLYHISEKNTELSILNVKQIRANTRPKVGMYAEFYYANPQIFLFPYNPYWYSLGIAGIKASFPLSSIYHNIHKLKAAKLELEKEEEIHKDTEDKVRQQVWEAFLKYREAIEQIKVARINLDHALENERIIKNSYFNQASLITDLLDANVQQLRSRFDLAAAMIMAQNKYYLLQNVTGVL
ncbi:TolC family protein [Dyadobacter jiangsuensis]